MNESRLVVNASSRRSSRPSTRSRCYRSSSTRSCFLKRSSARCWRRRSRVSPFQNLSSTAWLRIEPDVPVPDDVASWDLGAGETQVLALGRSRGGVELILDENRQARRCVESLGLPTTVTLGLILRAKWRGFIPAARPSVERLIEHRLYLAHDLVEAALAEVGDSPAGGVAAASRWVARLSHD